MVVYLSKPMIMRINQFVGISRMRRFRMVDMCKGKRKLWLRGTDDGLVVGLHMVGKKSESFVSQQRDILPCTFYFSFTRFIPLISFLTLLFSLSLLFLSFFHSHIFSLSLLFYIFSFFLFHTHTFLFIFHSLDNFSKLSTPLFLACIQSEILNK
jgi:hypothetical protein